jgi:uncharacterized membrane protein YjfL (UPF0719 family)
VSGDELMVTVLGGGAGAVFAIWWYARILRSPQAHFASYEFIALALAPLIALCGVFAVIVTAGSLDVRSAPEYIFMYCGLGVAWYLGATFLLEVVGISFRDDAIERRNSAAAIAIVGAMFGHASVYAGANIGNGPGWWTVVIAGALGSGTWFVLWSIVQVVCKISDDITVDRDVPAGLRLGGYALAMGLVCARGAAGDWTSFDQTVREFVVAWPVLPLTAAVIVVEKFLETQPRHYIRGAAFSIFIAGAYLASSAAAITYAGPLPHNPQYDKANATSP